VGLGGCLLCVVLAVPMWLFVGRSAATADTHWCISTFVMYFGAPACALPQTVKRSISLCAESVAVACIRVLFMCQRPNFDQQSAVDQKSAVDHRTLLQLL
jgi:hypothetical protein